MSRKYEFKSDRFAVTGHVYYTYKANHITLGKRDFSLHLLSVLLYIYSQRERRTS